MSDHESSLPPDDAEERFVPDPDLADPLVDGGAPASGDGDLAHAERLYTPAPGEAQLTVRAVVTGCCLGVVVASMNIYFGLKTGWSIGGSLIAAILGFATWFMLSNLTGLRRYTVLETNITQTAGSAAGSMTSTAGLLSSIPALGMLGTKLAYHELVLWALAVGFLGVFYAVPLRNQLVVVEKLRFPTGTATAETIVSMFATGSRALAQAKTLLIFGFVAGFYTILSYFVPQAGHPPIETWLPEGISAPLVFLAAWGVSLLISPLMFGAGILIGPRVGSSLLAGALVGWLVLGQISQQQGWAPAAIMKYNDVVDGVRVSGPRGWILWPGVAIMVADALTNLALSWRTVVSTFRRSGTARDVGMEEESQRIPNLWWIGGLGVGTVLVTTVAWKVFAIPPWMTLIAVGMSWVLAMIAVRSTGETDINPTGGMGKVTQLTFGALAPGNTTTNLMAAGISSAGASQAGDMMQDLKTGRLLGASPRNQIIAQCIGVLAGVPICTAIYTLFNKAYEIGVDEAMPAPAAHAWKAMAELLSGGFDQLPPYAVHAVIAGAAFGILVPVLRRSVKPLAPFLPSSLAFGIAFIVPAYYSVAMFLGAMMLVLWRRLSPTQAGVFAIAVASGLIAGEGLMGVVTAVLQLVGISPLT